MQDEFYLDSEILAGLRQFLKFYPELEKLIGPIAQYKIVIDANIAIGDLLHKHKNPDLKQTAIEEITKSSAIELYAPTWLNEEMVNSTIPQVSKRRAIPETELQAVWIEYKKQIIWDDNFSVPEDFDPDEGDAKDIPYVALQKSIAAAAILSRDKDIDRLGGNRIDLEFVFSVRTYARAASYSVGIRVGGTFVTVISVGILGQIIKGLGSLVSQLPGWVKISLLLVIIFAAVHPASRERIVKFLQNTGDVLGYMWPEIEKLIDMTSAKQLEAETALGKAEQLLGS